MGLVRWGAAAAVVFVVELPEMIRYYRMTRLLFMLGAALLLLAAWVNTSL